MTSENMLHHYHNIPGFQKFKYPRQTGRLADWHLINQPKCRICSQLGTGHVPFVKLTKPLYVPSGEHVSYLLTANLPTCQSAWNLEFRKTSIANTTHN